MYDILQEINNVQHIVIKYVDDERIIPFKDISCTLPGVNSVTVPAEDVEVFEHYNQNLILSGGQLEGEMILLHDYGDYEGNPPGEEIPRWLLFIDGGSVGWYNGYLTYAAVVDNDLVVWMLKKYQKISFEGLNTKRPYRFWLLKGNSNSDNVKAAIKISYYEYDPSFSDWIFAEFPVNYNALTSPSHLFNISNKCHFGPKKSTNISYLSRELLVYLGWSYNADKDQWSKNNVTLFDDSGCSYNGCFRTNDMEYICTIEELNTYIKKYSEA